MGRCANAHPFFGVANSLGGKSPPSSRLRRTLGIEALEKRIVLSAWTVLSSAAGELPEPHGNAVDWQGTALVLDVDKDNADDFVVANWGTEQPGLEWWRRDTNGWTKGVIDDTLAATGGNWLEPNGTSYDIDQDGDLDLLIGEAFGNQIYWWENPYPLIDPNIAWTRHIVKDSGLNLHHDQVFGDFDGDGSAELVTWNQGSAPQDGLLLLAEIPDDPANNVGEWTFTEIFSYQNSGSPNVRFEGLAVADIDLDGQDDIVSSGYWWKHISGTTFQANEFETNHPRVSRTAVGQLIAGGRPEIVTSSGDSNGPLTMHSWNGSSWDAVTLIANTVHAHTLEVADINHDGYVDIFTAEMGQWIQGSANNADAKNWVLWGDGNGQFETEIVRQGQGNHEGRLGDLDGDGDLDILIKPFRHNLPLLEVMLQHQNGEGPTGPTTLDLEQWNRQEIDTLDYNSVFVTSGDIDQDGDLDIIAGGWWWEQGANDVWTKHVIGGNLKNMAAVHDFDEDGDLDVLGTEGMPGSNQFVWAENDGAGGFTIFSNVDAGGSHAGDFLQGAAVGRFQVGATNGAPLEVALSWHGNSQGHVQLLTVPSDPTTDTWQIRSISTTSQYEDLSVGDIDRDGDPDVLLGTVWLENPRNATELWAAHSIGTITAPTGGPDRSDLTDIDRDGWLDAVAGQQHGDDILLFISPQDVFAEWDRSIVGSQPGDGYSMDAGDIDNDGDADIVVGEHRGATNRVIIYENENDGASWTSHTIDSGPSSVIDHHDGTQLVDLDRDGDPDIVSIGWFNKKLWIYENLAIDATLGNSAPTAADDAFSVSEDTTNNVLDVKVDNGNGVDSDPDGDPLSITLVGTPDQGGTVGINNNGTPGDSTDDFIEYTAAADFVGSETFTYTIDDGNGQTDTATVTVTVTNANNDPPLAQDDAFNVAEDTTNNLLDVKADNGNGVDSDPDGDPLSIILVGTPDQGGTVGINDNGTPSDATDDFIEYAPEPDFIGSETFTYTIDDGNGQTDTATVTITVTKVSLLGHWKFDDDNGDNQADDSSGNGNYGTIQGPVFATGKLGLALDYDGADDYVNLGGLDVNGTELTIAAWIYADSFTYQDARLISKATGVQEQDHYWMLSTIGQGSETRLRFRLKTDGNTDTLTADSGSLSTGQWHHVAAVYDGSSMRLYLDGVDVGSQPKTGTIAVNPSVAAWIGRNPDNYGPFHGLIDDVRILQRALSANELGAIASGSPITSDDFCCGTLSTHWTFVDPLGDASLQMAGAFTESAQVEIQVPGGISHEPWAVNNAPRIMQQVTADTDFEIEVKFESALTLKYQMQGIIVEQDPNNYLRFDFFSDGAGINVFAASINNVSPSPRIFRQISIVEPMYMRVTRAGDQWTFSYSDDGTDWTVAGSFVEAMTVERVGVFAGNHSADGTGAPPFTARVDYFFETRTPIILEDAGANTALADFNGDGAVTAADIDLLFAAQRTGSTDPRFDLNDDSRIDRGDVDVLVHDILGTRYGDANLDGQVDAKDLNDVGLNWAGTEKTWAQGDFTGDSLINAADLNVLALNWRSGVEAQASAADRTGEDLRLERLPRAPLAVANRPIAAPARHIGLIDADPNADGRQLSAAFAMARTRLGILGRRPGR